MYLSVVSVKPIDGYRLFLEFENGEQKVFDMSKYLEIGKFKELKDLKLFSDVRVSFDTIEWGNGLDLDPEILYRDGEICVNSKKIIG